MCPRAGVTGQGQGLVYFTVPFDAPSTLYYQCSVHANTMWGYLQIGLTPPVVTVGACCNRNWPCYVRSDSAPARSALL